MHEEALYVGDEVVDSKVNDARTKLTELFLITLRNREGRSLSRTKEGKMKIEITAQSKELSSEIDMRFGRAKWLIVIDTQTNDFQAHDNVVNLSAVQGAGIQTGQNIANLDVQAVITGNIGPNAFKTLSAANIKVFLSEKQTVAEATDSLKAGKLKEVEMANVEGHWS